MSGRTVKSVGRELEIAIRTHGWGSPEVDRLEREFWAANEREKARRGAPALRIAVFTIATERGATLEQAVEAVREAEAQ